GLRPHGDLSCVAEQVLHDAALLGGVLDADEVLSLLPAVGHRLLPARPGSHADQDVQTLIAQVEALAATLRPVPEDGGDLVGEDSALPLDGPVAALDDLLGDAVDLDGLHHWTFPCDPGRP